MRLLPSRMLLLPLAGLLFVAATAMPPAMAQPVTVDAARPKEKLVERYVNADRFDGLYKSVLDQYLMLSPKKAQAEALIEDETFENQIFGIVQKHAVTAFSMDELNAVASFMDTPEGKSIADKANRLGMSSKSSDFTADEKAALNRFKASPEGRSVASKSVTFVSTTLSDVMRTFLVRQAMANTLQ